ncbi:MAG: phosphatidate cytidylyltransferase [Treponema sp.]|nr:phosphatidate cytidylyltransferase [Treponema sp.]
MSKVISRLLVFFVGIPIVCAIIFADVMNHLPMHLLLTALSILGSAELYEMFSKKGKLLPKPFVVTASMLLPLGAALYAVLPDVFGISFPFGIEVLTYIFLAIVLFSLFVEVFFAREFDSSILRVALSVFVILYCGYLMTFVSRLIMIKIDGRDVSSIIMVTFVLMVFFCDSFAWLFGVLLGKSTRGVVKASPNKSLVGFFGGILGSVGAGLLCSFFFPAIFHGSVVKVILLGLFIALASIVGDLAESVFKRSCGVKDSGSLMPGRGGILDSIDSIIMAAPVFYLIVNLLYGPFFN